MPTSLRRHHPQIGHHFSVTPTHPQVSISARTLDPSRSVAATPHAFVRVSLLLAGASDESIADIGFLLPIPPPSWPQAHKCFFRFDISSSPVTCQRQAGTTNTTPSQHHSRHQTTGTQSGDTFLICHLRLCRRHLRRHFKVYVHPANPRGK